MAFHCPCWAVLDGDSLPLDKTHGWNGCSLPSWAPTAAEQLWKLGHDPKPRAAASSTAGLASAGCRGDPKVIPGWAGRLSSRETSPRGRGAGEKDAAGGASLAARRPGGAARRAQVFLFRSSAGRWKKRSRRSRRPPRSRASSSLPRLPSDSSRPSQASLCRARSPRRGRHELLVVSSWLCSAAPRAPRARCSPTSHALPPGPPCAARPCLPVLLVLSGPVSRSSVGCAALPPRPSAVGPCLPVGSSPPIYVYVSLCVCVCARVCMCLQTHLPLVSACICTLTSHSPD